MEKKENQKVQDHIPFASEAYLEDTLHMPSWLIMTLAGVIIFGIVFSVLDHARKKPMSPQELVAAALTRPITAPTLDWKAGMGPQPLIYHPAAFQPAPQTQASPTWNPLYICPVHGGTGAAISGLNGFLYCSICNQPMVMNK